MAPPTDRANVEPVRRLLTEAHRVLADAGVDSPRVDAELLAAHAFGVPRSRLVLVTDVPTEQADEFRALITRRVTREPVQHITGTAVIGRITLAVGPGVFVPRPETDLLLDWAVSVVRDVPAPMVVDLCAGSGALALGFADLRPDATVYAVERDPDALGWARRNADRRAVRGDTPIIVVAGDVTDPTLLADLTGLADLVLSNPPYVPTGTPIPPEVARHDPPEAVFGGPDGLSVIRSVVTSAVRLLRPGGRLAIEHDDSHAGSVPALLIARRTLTEVSDHQDLVGRPRFATARRAVT